MRKFILSAVGLGLALAAGLGLTGAPAQPVGAPNEIVCNRVNNSSSGATVITAVAAVANRSISICGYSAHGGAAAGTFQLLGGQGATCGTQTVTITPVVPLPINVSVVDRIDHAWVTLPILSNLCVSITGTGPVGYNIYYTQF